MSGRAIVHQRADPEADCAPDLGESGADPDVQAGRRSEQPIPAKAERPVPDRVCGINFELVDGEMSTATTPRHDQ